MSERQGRPRQGRRGLGDASPSPPPSRKTQGEKHKALPPAPAQQLLAEQPWTAKLKSLRVRTISTLLMVSGFLFILYLGHVVTCGLVFLIQACDDL